MESWLGDNQIHHPTPLVDGGIRQVVEASGDTVDKSPKIKKEKCTLNNIKVIKPGRTR
jgi:hypothetical protein